MELFGAGGFVMFLFFSLSKFLGKIVSKKLYLSYFDQKETETDMSKKKIQALKLY